MTMESPGDFEQQVLLVVWRLGPTACGGSVRDELEARTGRDVAKGAVYVTLVRLEKKGLLRSSRPEPAPVRSGKAKRCFAITPAGIEGLCVAPRTLDSLWHGLPAAPRGRRFRDTPSPPASRPCPAGTARPR